MGKNFPRNTLKCNVVPYTGNASLGRGRSSTAVHNDYCNREILTNMSGGPGIRRVFLGIFASVVKLRLNQPRCVVKRRHVGESMSTCHENLLQVQRTRGERRWLDWPCVSMMPMPSLDEWEAHLVGSSSHAFDRRASLLGTNRL